ncbi:MAG: GNAT family N-acetyltransferase [Eubacteriales bacterium]|nr:GNAT family N-acetyltransferase [Eubacteriales bacterium]
MEEEWELDPAFAQRDALRKAGRPVEIARTERLILRETVEADIPALYRIGRDPRVEPHITPMKPTLEEETEYTRAYIRHAYAFYDFGLWTVLVRHADGESTAGEQKEGGRIIGRAGLFPSERLPGQVELGYLIAPEQQGKGYGRECAAAILKYAFDVLELPEAHLFALPENLVSVRVAEALGPQERDLISSDGGRVLHYRYTQLLGRV